MVSVELWAAQGGICKAYAMPRTDFGLNTVASGSTAKASEPFVVPLWCVRSVAGSASENMTPKVIEVSLSCGSESEAVRMAVPCLTNANEIKAGDELVVFEKTRSNMSTMSIPKPFKRDAANPNPSKVARRG